MPNPTQNGADYAQNYDIVVKWMAAALRGQTLEVLGLETGRIEEVFGFEPVDLPVKAGRVDVIVRDDKGALYHIESQRNVSRADMHRFASQHFSAAAQWGHTVTDVILASGNSTISTHTLTTASGHYAPIFIDFATRDGRQRLAEIRQAVASGETTNLMELVFLPLYGKEPDDARTSFAEQVVRFEIELFQKQRFSDTLLAATLIMANKLLGKERIKELWEEIKMLDIIEVAMEKGRDEGRDEGRNEGRSEGELLGVQKMVLELLIAKFNLIPQHIAVQIKKIQEVDVLRGLFHAIVKCDTISDLEATLSRV